MANGGKMAHVAPGSGENDVVICHGSVKTSAAPIAPPASADLIPARRHSGRSTGVFLPAGSGGTGVFMPRADAYHTRAFKSPGSKGKWTGATTFHSKFCFLFS